MGQRSFQASTRYGQLECLSDVYLPHILYILNKAILSSDSIYSVFAISESNLMRCSPKPYRQAIAREEGLLPVFLYPVHNSRLSTLALGSTGSQTAAGQYEGMVFYLQQGCDSIFGKRL